MFLVLFPFFSFRLLGLSLDPFLYFFLIYMSVCVCVWYAHTGCPKVTYVFKNVITCQTFHTFFFFFQNLGKLPIEKCHWRKKQNLGILFGIKPIHHSHYILLIWCLPISFFVETLYNSYHRQFSNSRKTSVQKFEDCNQLLIIVNGECYQKNVFVGSWKLRISTFVKFKWEYISNVWIFILY